MERTLRGISASPGIAIGQVRLLRWELPSVPDRFVSDDEIESEIGRFRAALERAKERLDAVRARAERRAGPQEAAIFDVQRHLLDDPDMLTKVQALIRHNIGVEQAFHEYMSRAREKLAEHPVPDMRERVNDVLDVEIRVLSLLLGLKDHDPLDIDEARGAILVAHDLTPSLTIQLDRAAIKGIATDAGTPTSHIAILTRSLGIPAVVGLRDATDRLQGGELVILDATAGTLNVNPTEGEIELFIDRAHQEAARDAELARLATAEPVTLDGVRITLRANVDLPEEADNAARSGAEGVGLMRTEFLVVSRATMPDEGEQYEEYRRVVEAFPGQPVIIRTYDIGGDKLPVGGYPHEPNPFLGWRAIRMCLDQPEMFKTQLRALMRAAVHGEVQILLPLIVTVDEVDATKTLMREAAAELAARGVPHRADVPLGAMIETPAAALAAPIIAAEVSFFSIGTNDLTQYTLAVDRGNANIAGLFTPLHPSVLMLIRRTVDAAAERGIRVAVCGEMGSHVVTAFMLIGLGIRELSVAPRAVPLMKRLVRGITAEGAAAAAGEALAARSAAQAEAIARARLAAALGDESLLSTGLPRPEPAGIIKS